MKNKKADSDSSSFRKEPEAEQTRSSKCSCRFCCIRFTSIIFSPVGLGVFVLAYCIMGAFLFRAIEAPHELGTPERVSTLEKETVSELWLLAEQTRNGKSLNQSEFESSARRLIMEMRRAFHSESFAGGGLKLLNGGHVVSHGAMRWSFTGALLYSVSIITTVGYCQVIPYTSSGQSLTILYALIGIPLFIAYLLKMGRCLANCFRAFYRIVCCDLLCCRRCERNKRRRRFSSECVDDIQSLSLYGLSTASDSARVPRDRYNPQRDQTTTTKTSNMTLYPHAERHRDPSGSDFVGMELMKPADKDRLNALIKNDDAGNGKWNASGSKRYSSVSKKTQRAEITTAGAPLTATNLSAHARLGVNHVYEKIPYGDRSAATARIPTDLATVSTVEEGTRYRHGGRRVASGTMSLQHRPKSSQIRSQLPSSDEMRSRQEKYYGQTSATASLDRKQLRGHISTSPFAFTPFSESAGTIGTSGNVGAVIAQPVFKRQSLQQNCRNAPSTSLKPEYGRNSRCEKPDELPLSAQGLKFINRHSNPVEARDYSVPVTQPARRQAAKMHRSISADTQARRISGFTGLLPKTNAEVSCAEKVSKHLPTNAETFKPKFSLGREKLCDDSAGPTHKNSRSEMKKSNKSNNARHMSEAIRRSNDSFVTAPSDTSSSPRREPSTSRDGSSAEDIARTNRPRRTHKKSTQPNPLNRTKKNMNEECGGKDNLKISQKERHSKTHRNKSDEKNCGSRVLPPSTAVSDAPLDYVLLQETYSPGDLKPCDSGESAKRPHRITIPISMTLAIFVVYIGSGTLLFSALENVGYLAGSYFCFMTLTTIGFGDVVPGNGGDYARVDEKRIACAVWVACGLSVVAMCVNLAHERIVERCDANNEPNSK